VCIRGMGDIAGVHIKARRNVTLIYNRFCGWLIAASLLSGLESRQRASLLPMFCRGDHDGYADQRGVVR